MILTTVPVHGEASLHLQVENGDVALVATNTDVVRIRAASAGSRIQVTRVGKSLLDVTITGHPGVKLPFVQYAQGAVAYEILYPQSMRLEAADLTGNVLLRASRTAAAVETQSGNISIDGARGNLDLLADDGTISAALAPDWRGNELRLQASGTLRLQVPQNFSARVDASTGQGSVHNGAARGGPGAPFIFMFTEKGDVWITTAPRPQTR
jgi:DUF4097 and DUF4098 domain-containing protein YvlB